LTTQDGVRLLHCNQITPILRYTGGQPNVALWSNNLLMAIVYGMAGHIAQPLSGKTSLTAKLVEKANEFILAARVNSANQNQQAYDVLPEWIEGRGYANGARQQFFYPTGSLLRVG
jgi:hypothetical protein